MNTRLVVLIAQGVSTALFLLPTSAATCGDVPQFAAPATKAELDARIAELRKHYEPYWRSLAQPLPPRPRTKLPAEWRFTYEAKQSPEVEGVPPPPAWYVTAFDDSKWETTTVPEWCYRTREGDDTAQIRTRSPPGKTRRPLPTRSAGIERRSAAVRPPASRRQWLCFNGVDWEAQVRLNGNRSARTASTTSRSAST